MDDHHVESRGHMILLATIICPIFTGIFVALRAYARLFITKKLSASDWVSFITLVWILAFSGTLAQATYTGMGRHKTDLNKELEEGMEFWILVSSVFYVLSLAGYKGALVLLYLQIFGINRKFRYTCYVVLAYTWGYLFCNLIVQIAGCTPVEKFWDKKIPGHCTKTVAQDIAFGVGHMTSDFLIAMLPLPMIWKLQLRNMREKVGLFLVLGTGVIAWIVAVIRFTYATVDLTSKDRTWIAGITFFLSVLEVNTGLICGCTPALKPLFISIKESSHVWSRKLSSSYDANGKRKDSGSDFLRKRSEGDPNSPGGNSLHHLGRGSTELKNVSGSGNSSSNSAPTLRRPTVTGATATRPDFDSEKGPKTAGPISRAPMPRKPGSDTWDVYIMRHDHYQQPPVSQARLGASPIPHLDSDELFKGNGGSGLSEKHHASDDVEAQHEDYEQPRHRHQQSNPNEQSVRDFLADGPRHPRPPPPLPSGFVPRAPRSQAPSQPPPTSNPSAYTPTYPLPQAIPQDHDVTYHATRVQILLEQQNRPPSDRQLATLTKLQQHQQQRKQAGQVRFWNLGLCDDCNDELIEASQDQHHKDETVEL